MVDTQDTGSDRPAAPELNTEVAHRHIDPFEVLFGGVIRPNDSVLNEKGGQVNAWQIYRDLKRDGKVAGTLGKRINSLIGQPWQVQPVVDNAAGQAAAQVVTEILQGSAFDALCSDLMEALLCGLAVEEVVWTARDGRIVPERYAQRAQRRFRYVQPEGATVPELRMLTQSDMLQGVALPARKFIVHRCGAEDDNPYGMGLGHQLYWPVYFKRRGIVAWNKLVDRFGTPTPWGKYPNGADNKAKGTLFDALKAFSSDGVVMTPEGMSIELLESRLTGSVTTQEALVAYMDDWIGYVVLGQEPRGGSGGAQASAASERETVRFDLVQADSALLSGTLNSTLMGWICELNGLPACRVSRQIEAPEDKKAASETDKNVASLGFKPSLNYVRGRYGDGWEPAAPPMGTARPAGAPQFAEPAHKAGSQAVLDAAAAALPGTVLADAAQQMLTPLLAALGRATSYEEALAVLETALPTVDSAALQRTLAEAMFGAGLHGAVSANED